VTRTADDLDLFEQSRPRLLGIAYRMVGTMADADDIVQEAWMRWNDAHQASIHRPEAWLTTVTARIAIDFIRASSRRREEYLGPWLPDPVVADHGPEATAELADSLRIGFLRLLDTLDAVERAVFLLVDVFGVAYADVARGVGKSEVACRQVASRARRRLRGALSRRPVGEERRLVDELISAVARGDLQAALERLAPDVVLVTDGGATRPAARRPIEGAARVASFLVTFARRSYARARVVRAVINGDPGIITYVGDGIDFVAAFDIANGAITGIWLVRNPDKLNYVTSAIAIR
jgi:RNA polymerase sigma-70 factor (ECF subfamily)